MKNLFKLCLVVILAFTLFSCSKKKNDQMVGKWPDIIKLSSKTAVFNASGDSIAITTGGSWWWVNNVGVLNPGTDTTWYYNFKGVNLESDHYSIKQACFNVKRIDSHTLFIKVEANPKNVKRIITVGLQAGDYFDGVTITQLAK